MDLFYIIIDFNLLGLTVFILSMIYTIKAGNKKRIEIVGVLIGLVFMVFSMILGYFYNNQRINYTEQATGRIVDVHVSGKVDSNSDVQYTYYPIVQFSVDGQEHKILYSYGSNKEYKIGEEVKLRYNPEEPEKFLLEGEKSMAIASILISIFGLIFITLSTFMPKYISSNRR